MTEKMIKIYDVNLFRKSSYCDKYDLVRITGSSEMIHRVINHGARLYVTGDISALDFIVYNRTCCEIKLLVSHFFIIKVSSPWTLRLNRYIKIIKKSHTKNSKIFSDQCRLSFICKLWVSRKLFPYSENKI